MEGARALYEAKRYREALAVIDALRVQRPQDASLMAYAGHCKLGLGDHKTARDSYTEALGIRPPEAGCLIGRARCEIALGSPGAAEADIALARRVGAKDAAAVLAEAEGLLAKVKANGQGAGERQIRREQYTRELCSIELEIRDHPKDAQKLLALVRFHLEPTAVCDVTLAGIPTKARVPCGKMDVASAADALARATKMAPDQPLVLLHQARLEFARGRLDDMMVSAERALAKNTVDLEIAVAYLEYDSSVAKGMSAEAQQLRAPGTTWYTDNPDGTRTQHYRGPSADAYTRADALDAKAKALRAKATHALEVLQALTAGRVDTQAQVTGHMGDAYHDLWFGNLDGAIRAAETALALDTVNLHALRFLIAACGKAGSARAAHYRAVLDEIVG